MRQRIGVALAILLGVVLSVPVVLGLLVVANWLTGY